MLQLSHQPYPLPSTSSSATLIIHPLSASQISSITTSPYSRYSKLASLITQAQSLATPSSSNVNTISPTISLPPLNPLAVKFLLRFLETGDSTPGEASSIRKADIRRAFEVLGVEFPPGFDYTEGFIDGLGLGSEEYMRGKEDYSSPEIYEAKMRIELEEGFRIDISNPGVGSSETHSSSAHRASGHGSHSMAAPPSYAVSEFTNPRGSAFSLHGKGSKGDSKNPEKSTLGPQSEFHAALQDSLLTKLYTLLLSHIQPALTTQAQLGIFRGSFILLADPEEPVPMSQVVTSSPHEKIGDVTLGYREVIYLPTPTQGVNDGFSQVFLVQSAVVRGIKSTVKEALGVPPTPPRIPTPPPPPTPPPQKKKGWFGLGRKKTVKVAPPPPPPPAPVVAEPEPSTVVDVRVEDVWIRKENKDGLLGTRCVKGVVVWVEVKQDGYAL